MRAWVVLLLVAPVAAAEGGQLVERDGWTQFVPYCTPAPSLGLVIMLLGALALTARASGRGRA